MRKDQNHLKNKPGVMQTCIPNTQETETEELQVPDHPGLVNLKFS